MVRHEIGDIRTREDKHESADYCGVLDGKATTRASRRFHRRRMIGHARSIFIGALYEEELAAWAEKRHDHLCRCKCYLCHNKRKKFGRTLQERRAFQSDAIGEFERGWVLTNPLHTEVACRFGGR